MHRALAISEVLDMIFAHALSDSLAAIAQTSTHFFIPAVRKLWKDIDVEAFQHLIVSVMNEDVRSDDQKISPSFSMAARLRRFRIYSALVQSLHIEGDLFAESLHRLGCVNRDRPLLPRLRRLHYQSPHHGNIEHIFLFLGPALKELILTRTDVENDRDAEWDMVPVLPALLEALVTDVPDLQKFHLQLAVPMDYNSIHLHPMVAAISGLRKLTSFKIDTLALQPTLLPLLAEHPSLQELSIGAEDDRASLVMLRDVKFQLPAKTSFPSLRILDLNLSGSSSIAMQLLKSVRISLQLEELRLQIHVETFGIDLLTEFSLAISNFSGICRIVLYFEGDPPDFPNIIPWHAFSPLLRCREITHFRVEIRRGAALLDLCDDDVLSLANAWPELIRLELRWWSSEPPTHGLVDISTLTLKALMSLAQRCLYLKFVKIDALDARIVPVPIAGMERSQVIELELDDAMLSEPEDVAAFIGTIWPNAVVRVAGWNRQLRDWNAMNTVLRGVQKHRALQNVPR